MPRLALGSGRCLWYEEQGEGPPLVLLHGWCMSSLVWRFQLEALSRDFRVIAPDMAGHGRSDALPEECDLSGFGADLVELFRSLDLQGALLAGWSLGAQLALWGCMPLRQRLSGLILVSGTPRFSAAEDFPHALEATELRGMAAMMRRNPNATLDTFISRMFVAGECDEPFMTGRIAPLLASIPRPETRVALQGLRILAEADLRSLLQTIDLPTLIMGGDRDRICLPPASTCMAGMIPGAGQIVFPGCGHAPFLTRCDEFNRAITDFSRRIFEQGR